MNTIKDESKPSGFTHHSLALMLLDLPKMIQVYPAVVSFTKLTV